MTNFQAVIKVSRVAELVVWAIRTVLLFAVSLSAFVYLPMLLGSEGADVAMVKALLVLFGVPLTIISIVMIVKLISAYKYVVSDN